MIVFKPSGSLDVNTDPCDLPQSADKGDISSTAMQRCKNLRLEENGVAKTRDGSRTVFTGMVTIKRLIELAGKIYAFGTSIYEDGVSLASGKESDMWTGFAYNPFNTEDQSIYATNGTDMVRIQDGTVYDWGADAPDLIPVLSPGSDTVPLTGDYRGKITLCVKQDDLLVSETDPGERSEVITLASQALVYTVYITDTAALGEATHIRFYRTSANGEIYYYDGEIPIPDSYGATYAVSFDWELVIVKADEPNYVFPQFEYDTGYACCFEWEEDFANDDTGTEDGAPISTSTDGYLFYETGYPDASLGTEIQTDHDAPPLGTFAFGPSYNGTCFIIKDNRLYYSQPKQPDYWPEDYYVEVGPQHQPGVCAVFFNGQIYYLTKTDIWLIQGTGANTFFPVPMAAVTGAQGINGALAVAGHGIYHVGSDGIYVFNGQIDRKITQNAFGRIFRGETVNGVPGVIDLSGAWLFRYKTKLYFGYKGVTDTQETSFTVARTATNVYPRHILVFDLVTEKTSYYDYGIEISAVCEDETGGRFLAADSDGYIWELENGLLTQDEKADIAWEVQSKDFTMQTRKHFPRWVKYDVDGAATGEVLLDGVSIQTHTITGTRDTRRRLVKSTNGNRLSHKLSGSGQAKIYMVESE